MVTGFQIIDQSVDEWREVECNAARPIGQHGAINLDPLPAPNLGLPVKGKVVAEFGHDSMDGVPVRAKTARHREFRRRGLRMGCALARPAYVLGTHGDQHPEPGRHNIEPFGAIFPDTNHLTAPTGAGRVRGFDHLFDTFQMLRQPPFVPVCRGRLPRRLAKSFIGGLSRGRQLPFRDLDIFSKEIALIGITLFRAWAKPRVSGLEQQPFQPCVGLGQSRIGRLCAGQSLLEIGNIFRADLV